MPTFKSKLARYNCCEQVMPVPVIPRCAISCCLPSPILSSTYKMSPILHYPPDEEPPIGTILTNITGTIPEGYVECDGREISRIIYANLFSVIGTYFGGSSNMFNVPDLKDQNGTGIGYIIKF